MKVTIDEHSGFCFGVTTAIETAERELQKGQLFCLGDIVHNGQEVERLDKLGLVTIDYDDLRTLHSVRVLLRAHGEPPTTYRIALQNNIEIIDASCPVVLKLQKRIRQTYMEHMGEDAQIVIFGQKGHAEVIGLEGQTNNTAIVVESVKDLDVLDYTKSIYLFSQTTKSIEGFGEIVSAIESKRLERVSQSRDAVFEYHDTICRNVANRVKRLQDFAQSNDVCSRFFAKAYRRYSDITTVQIYLCAFRSIYTYHKPRNGRTAFRRALFLCIRCFFFHGNF